MFQIRHFRVLAKEKKNDPCVGIKKRAYEPLAHMNHLEYIWKHFATTKGKKSIEMNGLFNKMVIALLLSILNFLS